MHGSIRNRLEFLLTGKGECPGVEEHLLSCQSCSSELEAMRSQAKLIRTLRVQEEVEPAAGFYARVMQRIEERAKDSIWGVFIYSPFGKRLAFASLTIAVLLGSYVLTAEGLDGHLLGENMVAQQLHEDPLVTGDQAQQRDAVLQNFALHQGSIQ
jgi:predicted anti-sigma-YlaC factor YlaD